MAVGGLNKPINYGGVPTSWGKPPGRGGP